MSNDRCLWCEKRKEGVWLGACPKCAAEIQKKGLQFGGLKFDGVTQEEVMRAWEILGDPNLLKDEKNIITTDAYGVCGGECDCPTNHHMDVSYRVCKKIKSDEKDNKNPGGRAGCDQAECSEE